MWDGRPSSSLLSLSYVLEATIRNTCAIKNNTHNVHTYLHMRHFKFVYIYIYVHISIANQPASQPDNIQPVQS